MDASAIEKIQEAGAVRSVLASVTESIDGCVGVVALPPGYTLHDVEHLQDEPLRFRGVMQTADKGHFVAYCGLKEAQVTYVDAEAMTATAHFDLGDFESPGFDDHRANLTMKRTAEFQALKDIEGKTISQQQCSEWFEDWADLITAKTEGGEVIDQSTLVSIIRRIEIRRKSDTGHEVDNYRASRSSMESVEAQSKAGELPRELTFTCAPYHGLSTTGIPLRLAMVTGGDEPRFVVRIRAEQRLVEAWARELSESLAADLSCPVFVGSFTR